MARVRTSLSPAQQKQYRTAVERVNKQLYRLEKSAAATGENILDYAYKNIQRDIKSFFGDQKRFSKAMPKTMREFQKRMNAINRFYSMPTSTVSGMKKVYKKRAESISKRMGVTVTADQLKKVFETGLFRELYQQYGSKTAMKMIGAIEKQKDKILDQMAAGEKIKFSGEYSRRLNSAGVDDILERYLKENAE